MFNAEPLRPADPPFGSPRPYTNRTDGFLFPVKHSAAGDRSPATPNGLLCEKLFRGFGADRLAIYHQAIGVGAHMHGVAFIDTAFEH